MENNKLIAEFMGMKSEYKKYTNNDDEGILTYKYPINKTQVWNVTPDELKYHNDWNWIMEIVDKIEGMGCRTELLGQKDNYNFQIGKRGGHYPDFDSDGETKILAVYGGVVQFIEWFNAAQKGLKQ